MTPRLLRLHPRLLLALGLLLLGAPACRQREPPENTRLRIQKEFLERQLVGLGELLAKAERGELVRADQIALSLEEGVAKEILNASLPREQTLGGRVHVRIESATPFFRGNQAALVFRARARSEDWPNAYADLELAGSLEDLKLVDGRLRARVKLVHFLILEASVGQVAVALVERLVRENLGLLQDAIPAFEIPVRLDETIRVGRFDEGPVSAPGGELPLKVEVAEVVNIGERMWILLDVSAGPWKATAK